MYSIQKYMLISSTYSYFSYSKVKERHRIVNLKTSYRVYKHDPDIGEKN
jgi:hypothetical protein